MNLKYELKEKLHEYLFEGITSKNDEFIFEDAVNEFVRYYNAVSAGKKPEYKGQDLTELELTCCCCPIADNLSEEGLDYGRERDRGVLNLIISSAMQLGMNQGLKMGKQKGKAILSADLLNFIRMIEKKQ